MLIFNYQQTSDSPRYLFIADEFASLNFSNLDPLMNSNTAPGYPLFLAIIKLITQHNKFGIAIIQSILYCIALFVLVNEFYKKNIINYSFAILGFMLVLFSPEIIQSNEWTMRESLCGSSILIIFACFVNGFNDRSARILFVLSSSFLVLSRFEYLIFIPFLYFLLLRIKQFKLLISGFFILMILLLLNGYKNYLVFDKFTCLDVGSWSVVYGGNNLNGDGAWHVPEDDYNYLPKDQIQNYKAINLLDPRQARIKEDSLYKALVFQSWQLDPVSQLKLIPMKFLRLWLIPAGMDIYTSTPGFRKGLMIGLLFDAQYWPWYAKYKHGFYFGVHWIYLLLIICGFYMKIKNTGFSKFDQMILCIFIIISATYSIPFHGLSRYHVPVFGLLILYAPYCIQYIDRKIFKERIFKMLEKLTL